MATYKNLSGNSGVVAYEIAATSIAVQFRDSSTYTYTHESAGRQNIDQMCALAVAGRGLNSFINTHVKKLYASKR